MARPVWTAQCTAGRLVRELLPVRRRESHKGDYGRVLLLCGSEGLTGAARLAAKGALRTGSGLVYLGVPEKIYPIIAAGAGSEIVFPLPCDEEGRLCMASLPGMFDHTITCNSLSKTYSITGWRLGYLIGPERVVEAAKKVHDFLTVGAAAPLQEAAVVGLRFPEQYYQDLLALYTRKRDYFLAGLDMIGLKHNVPAGTYFVLVDIQEFLDLPQFRGYTDLEFCEWMIKNIGVAAVPGSSFFKEDVNHLIRFHFARQQEALDEALKRLQKLAELLPGKSTSC